MLYCAQAAVSRGNPHRVASAEIDYAFPPDLSVIDACRAALATAERSRLLGRLLFPHGHPCMACLQCMHTHTQC